MIQEQNESMANGRSSMERLQRDIIKLLEANGLASQNQIITSLGLPSVLVSAGLADLVRDGTLISKVVENEVVFFHSSFSAV